MLKRDAQESEEEDSEENMVKEDSEEKEQTGGGQVETRREISELIFGKGMRKAAFQFSESGGSLNGQDLFTELPFL